ncbi:S6 family peptidase, partial [Streptobacillus moniliformis]|uniref:S6 family peptidase n=1 Tax=Streptobacillus moniliformis TaxID=34105 RepID=UPI000AEE4EBE
KIPLITVNGTRILDENGNEIYNNTLSLETVKKIASLDYKSCGEDLLINGYFRNVWLVTDKKAEEYYRKERPDKPYIQEGITEEQWKKIKSDDLVARVGRGGNKVAIDYGVEHDPDKEKHFAGGLNKVDYKYDRGIGRYIQLNLYKEYEKTPIDSGTKPGDSGSPLFWWDKEQKKWFMAASHSQGAFILGYGKWSRLLNLSYAYDNFKKALTDEEITTETEVKFKDGKLNVSGKDREFKTKESIDIVKCNNTTKNQIFNKKDLKITVEGKTNTHAARLEFKQ